MVRFSNASTSLPLPGVSPNSSFICQLCRGFSTRSSVSSRSIRRSMFFALRTVSLPRLAKKPLANLSPCIGFAATLELGFAAHMRGSEAQAGDLFLLVGVFLPMTLSLSQLLFQVVAIIAGVRPDGVGERVQLEDGLSLCCRGMPGRERRSARPRLHLPDCW